MFIFTCYCRIQSNFGFVGGIMLILKMKLDSKAINSTVKPKPTTAHGSVKCVLALQVSVPMRNN